MNIIFLILILYGHGFEYKERPPIVMRTCKRNAIRQLTYDQEIQELIASFSKMSILKDFISNYQQHENMLTVLEGLTKVKDQSAIVNSELIQKVTEYKPQELKQYKGQKDPDDPKVVEYYDKIIDIEKKICNIFDNILSKNQKSSDQYRKFLHLRVFGQDLYSKIKIKVNSTRSGKVGWLLNQRYSIRDSVIEQRLLYMFSITLSKCEDSIIRQSQIIEKWINKIAQKIQTVKEKKYELTKLDNRSHNFIIRIKVAVSRIVQIYQISKPVLKSECASHKNDIEEDFLQFLKIQEIFKFKDFQNDQNKIVNLLSDNKDKYILNFKLILDQVKNINIRYIYTPSFNVEYEFSNPDSKTAYQIYKSYEEYIQEMNIIYQQIQQALELQQLLNEKFISDIKNQNQQINSFQFTYQQDDVYKELIQINRDYQICGAGKERYDLDISHDYKLKGKTIEGYREKLSSKLGYNEEYNCRIDISTDKHAILRDYQHLDLLNSYNIESSFRTIMNQINEKVEPYSNLNSLISKLNLRFIPVEFKSFQSNYKPDDAQAVKAYSRLQIINNRLIQLRNSYNEAQNYLTFILKNLKLLFDNYKGFNENVGNMGNEDEKYLKSYLKQGLEKYTTCTGLDFNEEYQIQKDQQFYNKKQKSYLTSLIDQKEDQNYDNKSILMTQINQQWKYSDYDPITQTECKDELEEIKEDILQFQKIQSLFYYKKNYQQQYNNLINNLLQIELDFVKNAQQLYRELSYYDFSQIIQVYKYPDQATFTQGPRGAYAYLSKTYQDLVFIKNEYGKLLELVKFGKVDFSAIRYNNNLLNEYLDEKFLYNEKEVEMELKQLYRDYEICTKRSYLKEPEEQKKLNLQVVLLQEKKKGSKSLKIKMRNKFTRKSQKGMKNIK